MTVCKPSASPTLVRTQHLPHKGKTASDQGRWYIASGLRCPVVTGARQCSTAVSSLLSSLTAVLGGSLRVAFQTRWSASASAPWTHFAYTFSSTPMLWPAHSATWAGSLVERSQVETTACRRLYGLP